MSANLRVDVNIVAATSWVLDHDNVSMLGHVCSPLRWCARVSNGGDNVLKQLELGYVPIPNYSSAACLDYAQFIIMKGLQQ